jgi:hypothetical protein
MASLFYMRNPKSLTRDPKSEARALGSPEALSESAALEVYSLEDVVEQQNVNCFQVNATI